MRKQESAQLNSNYIKFKLNNGASRVEFKILILIFSMKLNMLFNARSSSTIHWRSSCKENYELVCQAVCSR